MRTLSPALPLAAAIVLVSPGTLAAGGWRLRCPSMPREQPPPAPLRVAAQRFFPWVRHAQALRSGPFYLVALSARSAISRDGDVLDSSGYYLHRALLAIAPTTTAAATVRGARLGASGPRTALGFSIDGASTCRTSGANVVCDTSPLRFAPALQVPAGRGWRIVQTELRIGRAGCFALSITAARLRATIPLAVPGPDYGTPGW